MKSSFNDTPKFAEALKLSGLQKQIKLITFDAEDYRSVTINCFFHKQTKFKLRLVDSEVFFVLVGAAEFPLSNNFLSAYRELVRKGKRKGRKEYYKDLFLFYVDMFKNKKHFGLNEGMLLKMRVDLPFIMATLNSYKLYYFAKEILNRNSKKIFDDEV